MPGVLAAEALPERPGLLHAAGNYFATADGRAVYLAGDHTWTDNVGYTATGRFDFGAYLKVLQAEGANLTRLWAPDAFAHAANADFGAALLDVFQRTGPGYAHDGGAKYDLTRFNQAYFGHLRRLVRQAAAKGVYADVMLFFDYNMPGAHYGTWASNPWNGANNVNRTTRSDIAVEQGRDPHLLALQEAYVAKVLDTLRDEPNVLYEVANEARYDPRTYAWENTIIKFVHGYEARHGYLRHPVGMTALSATGSPVTSDPSVVDAAIFASDADWVSPTGGQYQSNPPDAPGSKVVIADTDHIFGIGGDVNWVWQQFTRGNNVLIMDDMGGTGLPGLLDTGLSRQRVAGEVSERQGVAETRSVAQMVDMTGMKPDDALASTGFALADPPAGDYVVYAPNGGQVAVDLAGAGERWLSVAWMDIATGNVRRAEVVSSGGTANLTPPFDSASALILTPRIHPER